MSDLSSAIASGPGSVHGTVINGRTHEPIAQGKAYAVTRTETATLSASGHDVTLAAGVQQELTARLTGGVAKLEGVAQKAGKPVAGVMVVLIPKDPEAHREYFRRDQSDFDGTFSVAYIVPGTYTIVAVEDAWGVEWLQPGVLARYAQHGQELTIGPLMRGTVHLPDPVEVQPKCDTTHLGRRALHLTYFINRAGAFFWW